MTKPTYSETSSSHLILRCHAPQPISLVAWRLGFVDVLLRFLVRVLAAEARGLDPERA